MMPLIVDDEKKVPAINSRLAQQKPFYYDLLLQERNGLLANILKAYERREIRDYVDDIFQDVTSIDLHKWEKEWREKYFRGQYSLKLELHDLRDLLYEQEVTQALLTVAKNDPSVYSLQKAQEEKSNVALIAKAAKVVKRDKKEALRLQTQWEQQFDMFPTFPQELFPTPIQQPTINKQDQLSLVPVQQNTNIVPIWQEQPVIVQPIQIQKNSKQKHQEFLDLVSDKLKIFNEKKKAQILLDSKNIIEPPQVSLIKPSIIRDYNRNPQPTQRQLNEKLLQIIEDKLGKDKDISPVYLNQQLLNQPPEFDIIKPSIIRDYNKRYHPWLVDPDNQPSALISFDFLARHCQQCKFHLEKQNRLCSRHTCYTLYCWQHQRKVFGVQVRKSNLPNAGMGLFNYAPRKKGDILPFSYEGQVMTNAQLDKKYGKDGLATYAINIRGTNKNLEPMNKDNPALFMNHNRRGRNQVTFMDAIEYNKNKTYGRVPLQINTRVYPGQELYANYGKNYWKS